MPDDPTTPAVAAEMTDLASKPPQLPVGEENGKGGAERKQTVICVFCGSSPGTSPIHATAARSLAQTFAAHQIKLVYGGGTSGLMGELARTLVSLSGPDAVHGVIPEALIRFEREGRPAGGSSSSDGSKTKEAPAVDTVPDAPSVSDGNMVTSTTTVSARESSSSTAAEEPAATTTASVTAENENDAVDPAYGHTTVVPTMHARKALMTRLVLSGGTGSGFCALPGGYGTLEELMEVVTWNQLGIHDRGVCVLNVGGYWDGVMGWIRKAVEEGFITGKNREIVVEAGDAEDVVKALAGYKVSEGRFRLDWGEE